MTNETINFDPRPIDFTSPVRAVASIFRDVDGPKYEIEIESIPAWEHTALLTSQETYQHERIR